MIEFSLERYRSSVACLRQSLGVGSPLVRRAAEESSVEEDKYVVVDTAINHFRFRINDLYLTHRRLPTESSWTEIKKHNYSQMRMTDETWVSGGRIQNAFNIPSPHDHDLAYVIIATAEAARSQVVYQIVQQMLQTRARRLKWGQLKELLIGSWIHNTTEHHKKKPVDYGALRSGDYYNQKAQRAIRDIGSAELNGFVLT